jgi:hypothetical protein
MTEVTASDSPAQAGSDENPRPQESGDLASVLRQVDGLLEERAFGAARAELETAFSRFGERAKLLTRLAAVSSAQDEMEQAMTTYRLAVRADPSDPDVAADYCGFLHAHHMQRIAIDFVTGLPADVAASPPIREALGAIYSRAGWAALAVDAYGDSSGLSRGARRHRLLLWWSSGGPVLIFRRWARDFDEQVRRNWYQYSESLSAFDDLGLASGFVASEVRGEVDAYLESWALIATKADVRQRIARHWLIRYLLGFCLAWATVFLTLNATRPDLGAGETILVAAGTAAAGLVLRLPLRAFVNAGSRFVFQCVRAMLATSSLVAVGILLIVTVAAPPAWPGVTGIALLAAVGMGALNTVVGNLPSMVGNLQLGSLRRYGPRAAVLERLLDLLSQVGRPDVRNDLTMRGYWIWLLEAAAKRTERDLPRTVPCRDPRTAEWARDRAAGAATALRMMKRHIAAPTPEGWDRLTAGLRHDASALASGNLGLMRWSQPPSAADNRKRVLRTALTVTQRVLVAAVPVVVIFALQPLLKLTGSDLLLARAGTIFWAVFYLTVNIDPSLVSKVQQAHDVYTEIRSISGPKP